MFKSGKIIKANGDTFDFETAKEFPGLAEMQKAVGGYITKIPLLAIVKGFNEPCVMILNEEGVPLKLPVNLQASMLAMQHVVGDVIVMPKRLFK